MSKSLTNAQVTTMSNEMVVAIDNAAGSDEILALLAEEGYTAEVLETGRALANGLSTAHSSTSTSLGSQKEATQTTSSDLQIARRAISLFRTKGRGVFPKASSQEAWGALKLASPIPQGTGSFITFGLNMVDEALKSPSIMSVLSGSGYDEAKLNRIRGQLESAQASNAGQEEKKGGRKGTTATRDAQLKETQAWWLSFKRTARQVLSSAQLTALGID